MFNDANSDPTLPVILVDRNRVTVNPETGDVMEPGGHVILDPVIVTGKMPDNLKLTINKNIELNRLLFHLLLEQSLIIIILVKIYISNHQSVEHLQKQLNSMV